MIFWAVLIIKEVLNILKVYTELKHCRSTVAQKTAIRTEEKEMTPRTITYPKREDLRSIENEATKYATDSVLNDAAKEETEANKPSGDHGWIKVTRKRTKNMTLYDDFHKHWDQERVLGVGGDGVVYLYQQRKQKGECIAVKVPRQNSISARDDLMREIENLLLLDPHDHILDLCHASKDWWPYGPAMFLPFCDLGDLVTYRESWCAQQAWKGKPERISELTMCKLFRDMVLALNYIHHELGTRYVHNDFKPGNILAVTPPNHTEPKTICEEPIFKLADFSRLTPWPTPKGQHAQGFDGTPEYAPPEVEQIAPVHTSADIWGLGATLQFMALGIQPIQSRKAFVLSRKAQGKPHPELKEGQKWISEYWRTRIPTTFRPIHVPMEVLCKEYDLQVRIPDYQPYSARLGYWYAQLWKPVVNRPKASNLVLRAIPHMDDQIDCIKKMRQKHKVSG